LSGEHAGLECVSKRLTRDGIYNRWLRIEYPFHSRQMDPLRDELIDRLRDIQPGASTVPFYSTVTGSALAGDALDARYWWDNVRQPVLFASAAAALVRAGHEVFLELGPHPALESSLKDALAAAERTGTVLHSLRRDTDDSEELLTNLAALHVGGAAIDWTAVNQASGAVVRLPQYPWNRETYWAEPPAVAERRAGEPVHPLLGMRVDAVQPTWQAAIDPRRLRYLADHRVWGRAVFPAAGFSEMAFAVAAQLFPGERHRVEALEIPAALMFADDEPTVVQTVFDPDDRTVSVHSRSRDGAWQLHARGTIAPVTAADVRPVCGFERLRASGEQHSHERYRAECLDRGYQFGPTFQQIRRLWCDEREGLAEIVVPDEINAELDGYTLHPAVLDACFQSFLGLQAAAAATPEGTLLLPHSIGQLAVHRTITAGRLLAVARLVSDEGDTLVANIRVALPDGTPVADIAGFCLARVEERRPDSLEGCFYRFEWVPHHLRGAGARGSCGFAASAQLVEAAAAASDSICANSAFDDYLGESGMRRATFARLIVNALRELGWQPARGDQMTLSGLVEALGITGEHSRITRVLVGELVHAGWLQERGSDRWEIVGAVPEPIDAAAELDRLELTHPASAIDLSFARRTGLPLAAILAGEIDPITLLFPDGSFEIVEQLYAHGSGFAAHLGTFRATLAHALAALPKDRSLRVLEVGAGTGTLTRTVLPVVPAHRTEYLFTDIGQSFLAAAQARFTGHPFIEYRVFDLERDPARQGIPTGHFDLVIASNALHATADLRQTLAHVRQTLAPGGLLLFLEVVSAEWALANITFGLLKGWWRVTDGDLRPASPWIGRARWLELLADAGFWDVGAVTCTTDPTQSEHATLIAFAPDRAADDAVEATPAAGGNYLVLADEGGVGDAVAARLAAGGHRCATIRAAGVRSIDEVSRAIEDYTNDDSLAGVIHCWSLDNPAADGADLDSMQAAQTGLLAGYSLVQRLRERTTPVWFVTRFAASATNGDRVDGLAAAPLTGLARVANNEHQCRFTVIDLDGCSTNEAAACLCDEVLLPRDGEFEIAYRDGVRHVLRLTPTRPDAFAARTFAAVKADGRAVPFRLQTSKPGILTNLALHETTRSDPRAGEIEVRVRAGGINFRDVMKALGTHPGHPIDLRWFGDDFAGVVERVGEGVETLRPGDDVAGMAPYAFRSFVTTDARMAFAKPVSISFEAAATLPTAFLTAHYALNELARLQPGERVLIHAAAGGVGQAAMQVARASGLEIFATAGTPEKRQLLRDMGAAHVMSSRSLEFADDIMDVTRGRGVDAVLNSLSGDFIPKSLSVLAPFGRFLEIGKVDIYRNTRIGLRPLRDNISYFVIDLTQHLRAKPDLIARLFGELACRFSSGVYRPLPSTVFPIANVVDAFRHMAQGRHVGKNVLAFDSKDVNIAYANEPGHRFRGDATYLITGGNGGFGLEVAKWIAREGGRHLALVSRSGPRDPEATVAIEDLRSDGIDVVDARGDVARPEDIERIVMQIRNTMPPLGGVFHAAMVLDDELVADLDETRIRRALDPKLAGGWNLHRATVACELDHFVCFSSFSAVLALPKQSNYNAGNVFLDQLAHYRRARGLPAVSINFGALAGAGYVERERKTSAALTRLGAGRFGVDEALRVLERVLFADTAQVGAARVDWERIQQLTPLVAESNTYQPVRMSHDTTNREASIVMRLRAASDEQRAFLIESLIASQVAAVFGTAADRIDRSASLSSLGLDSLMVLELTNRLERELSFRIPVGTLLGGPTVVELARTVLRLMTPALGEHGEAAVVTSAIPRSTGSGQARDRADAAPSPGGSGHIVTLRSGGPDNPIFAVHPVGGGVAIYSPMAAHLPRGAAVYGVESRMNLGEHDEYGTLDEMVDHYTAAIVDCSDEPYRLLGFSLGGYLAGRIAERLERSGRAVQCVGVIDWDLQDRGSTEAQRDSLIRMAVAAYHFAQSDVGLVRPLDERRLHGDISRIVDRILRDDRSDGGERFSEWVLENQLVASPGLEDVTRRHLSRFEQHCGLLAGSLPLPRFAAPLCVWRASHGFGSRLAAWEHPGEHNREHLVEGDHNAVIRPDGLALIGRQMTEFVSSIAARAIGVERGLPA
jgi:NADPH:quinone reductase-like Zn-dependent oxidoreductase/thioesterase domain-containing protein/SAM-dependent methyltransferase/acyl carrier protein